MKETWLSAYLYYGEPWETFLKEAVQPFVKKIMLQNLADRFFFLRYWERGPHIRLRFEGKSEILEEQLKPELESFFKDYFSCNPSIREEPKHEDMLSLGLEWFPNHSIQFISYEPEMERYGGPTAMIIGEDQFELSSRTVFSILESASPWTYDLALGVAIQLHLSFAHAVGMTLIETRDFYHMINDGFLGAFSGFRNIGKSEEFKKQRELMLIAFNERFSLQKENLTIFHRNLWEAMDKNMEFEQEWLNAWIEGMCGIRLRLAKQLTENNIVFPKHYANHYNERALWSIYSSYVHMTNNRLGIQNHDEAFLGYLIKRSLESM